MIKHKKIIISLLLAYALFIVGIFNVNAEEIHNFTLSASNYDTTSTITNFYLYSGTTSTINKGVGYIYGSYRTYMVAPNTYDFVYGVFVGNGGNVNACNISTATIDNQTTDVVIGSFICPYDSNKSFDFIRFIKGDNYTKINIHIPQSTITFIPQSGNSASDVSQIINTLQDGNITYLINQFRTRTNEQLVDQYNLINSIKSQLATNSTTISSIANTASDIKDTINDDNIDTNSTSSSTSSWANKNASNGTITQLLTLPISLLQAIVNGIQSSCSSFSLGSLFGTNITLPCINIGSLVGSALWTTIDILFSGFMILAIAKKLIKIFNDFTNLKTNQVDELYGGGK